MADFVLIHGASHGAWCWRDVTPRLEALGHTVRAVDLPSHGDDPTPPEEVRMEDYVRTACDALGGETILVGHSLGGLTITLAADRCPEKIRSLVYLCAWVPRPGRALIEYRHEAATEALRAATVVDRERGVTIPKPEGATAVFYSDCPQDAVDYALPRLSPQPISIMTEVLEFAEPRMPRHYIRCGRDRAIDPDYQHDVSAGWGTGRVHEMDCGHSPFFTDPGRLCAILNDIAGE